MLGKSKDMKPEFITGPGDYDHTHISIGKHAPKWSMQHKRTQSYATNNPPVGHYDVADSYNNT